MFYVFWLHQYSAMILRILLKISIFLLPLFCYTPPSPPVTEADCNFDLLLALGLINEAELSAQPVNPGIQYGFLLAYEDCMERARIHCYLKFTAEWRFLCGEGNRLK